eukprot:60883_1
MAYLRRFPNRHLYRRKLCRTASTNHSLSGLHHISKYGFGFYSDMNETDTTDNDSQTYHDRQLFPHSPESVFDVVADVAHYKEFVPWCTDSRVAHLTDDGCQCELTVGFNVFSEKYISNVTLKPYSKVISVAESGVFDFLETTWRFEPGPTSGQSWVDFHVAFRFRSEAHRYFSEMFFSEVTERMLCAFQSRCDEVYSRDGQSW